MLDVSEALKEALGANPEEKATGLGRAYQEGLKSQALKMKVFRDFKRYYSDCL